MTTLDFSIKLGANPNNLFSLITNYKNLPRFLPDQLKNVDILEEVSKAISSINCPIKDTLNKNLQIIKKNHREGQKRNRER